MMNKGDLFYVPSHTMLFGKGKILKTPEPTYLINLRELDSFYETFFENQKYMVRKQDTYPVLEESYND